MSLKAIVYNIYSHVLLHMRIYLGENILALSAIKYISN